MSHLSIKLTNSELLRIIHAIPDLYLILNTEFKIVDASDAYLKATMVRRKDILGRLIFDVFPDNPEDLNATGARNLRSSLENVVHNKTTDTMAVQKYDVRLPEDKGGAYHLRYWSPINSPVFNENNEVEYIIHRVEDVTDFIHLEEQGSEQQKLNEHLKSRAGQMEREIYHRAQEIQDANKKLRAAMELAEQANHAKSAFLATMSHEIRTPLNGVLGMTSLLEGTILNAEQREFVANIQLSGEALVALINDILDFSKIESGHFELDYVDFNLRQVIEDAVEIVAYKAHVKNLAIGALVESDVPAWVNSDSARLTQILINLISNAIKFTDKGEIELYVSKKKEEFTSEIPSQYCTLHVEVKDTGIGITPQIMETLFKAFSQGDPSVSRKYGGTGLGLAISKRLVEYLGGKIGVYSIPGEGSTFWFTIKVKEVKAHTPRMKDYYLPQLKGMHVLAVDDNAINRTIIQAQTSSWGMLCDLAVDGFDALDKLKKAVNSSNPYQLVFVDYNMPEMDGIELAQNILNDATIAFIPLLMLTSLGLPVQREKLDGFNIFGCLTKPVRQSKLYNAIISILKNTTTRQLIDPPEMSNPKKSMVVKNASILLAEDHPINQQVATHILKKLGYPHVHIVNNGIEAVYAFSKKHYDLILMDCQMPEMDGYAATKKIRQIETASNSARIPIIAMTAHALKGDKEHCLQVGMDDYIAKPVNIKGIEQILAHWLVVAKATPKTTAAIKPTSTIKMESNGQLDLERLHLIFGDNKKNISDFLHLFIQSSSHLLHEIIEAINQEDTNIAKEKCHQLKGSCGNAGANFMYDLVTALENTAIEKHWKEAKVLHKKLTKALHSIETLLLTGYIMQDQLR